MIVDHSSRRPLPKTVRASQPDQPDPMAAKFKHLNAKFMTLQKAVLSMANLTVVPVGHPMAEIAPVETDFHPGATTTIIAAAGMAMRLGMAPREFRGALNGRRCNFIFVKDFRQSWYQHGLLGLSASLDHTAEVLQGLLPPDTRSVRTIGSSSGGFAALQLGLRLGADRILAFAPQTRITPRTFKRFKTVDSDMSAYDFSAPEADLRNTFAAYPPQGEVRIVYGGKNAFDTREAMRLADVPGVTLHPLPNCPHHTVAAFARKTGALTQLLDRFTDPADPNSCAA